VVAADVEAANGARMGAGNGFEALNALKFPFEGPCMGECIPLDNLDGSVASQDVSGQPHFTIGALADPANQFMIRNAGNLFRVVLSSSHTVANCTADNFHRVPPPLSRHGPATTLDGRGRSIR